MKKCWVAAIALFSALSGFSAHAADEPAWYVGVTGGFTFMNEQDIDNHSHATPFDFSFKNGYSAGGNIGMQLPALPLRLEGEFMYYQNAVKSVSYMAATQSTGLGNYNVFSYMGNLYYDLPTGTNWSPYIGAGAGMIHADFSSQDVSDNHFAYQGMAGIGYTMPELNSIQWTLGYRYVGAEHLKLGNSTADYENQDVEIGAKYRF